MALTHTPGFNRSPDFLPQLVPYLHPVSVHYVTNWTGLWAWGLTLVWVWPAGMTLPQEIDHILGEIRSRSGLGTGRLGGCAQLRRSMTIAMPWPPPTHMVSR